MTRDGAAPNTPSRRLTHPPSDAQVCGVSDEESAVAAARAGASFIGLIFAKSKRQVTVARAAAIAAAVRAAFPAPAPLGDLRGRSLAECASRIGRAALSGGPLLVGVFMDAPAGEVNAAAEAAGLDLVQLHGSETYEYAAALSRPALKVLHIAPGVGAAGVAAEARGSAEGRVAAVLLDTAVAAGGAGGTGRVFDWDIAREVAALGVPCMVAGGLSGDNVGDAVARCSPWAVDASSGLEGRDGKKDADKIRAYVAAARGARGAR